MAGSAEFRRLWKRVRLEGDRMDAIEE